MKKKKQNIRRPTKWRDIFVEGCNCLAERQENGHIYYLIRHKETGMYRRKYPNPRETSLGSIAQAKRFYHKPSARINDVIGQRYYKNKWQSDTVRPEEWEVVKFHACHVETCDGAQYFNSNNNLMPKTNSAAK